MNDTPGKTDHARRPTGRRRFLGMLSAVCAGLPPRLRPLYASPENSPAVATGYVFDKLYLRHLIYRGHPESPRRLEAIEAHLHRTGLRKRLVHLSLLRDPLPHIRRVHTPEHIASIDKIKTTGTVARRAVAGALAAVDALHRGAVRNAFCAIRPPGHHAVNSGREEGFCFYNNVAVAARYAQEVCGYRKVLIIDWDYHHGNGTELLFYDDPSVLFFSTHDMHAYPGTGRPSRRGEGAGKGYTINVHLGRGADDYDMYDAWREHLLPAAKRFDPDIVLISAGFDSRIDDPLGCFAVSDVGFEHLTTTAMDIARDHCGGRLVSLLEGGYNVEGQARAVGAHVGALMEHA